MPDCLTCGTLVSGALPQILLVAPEGCESCCDECSSSDAKTGVSMSDGRAAMTIRLNRWVKLETSAQIQQDCSQVTAGLGFGNNVVPNLPWIVEYSGDGSAAVIFGAKDELLFGASASSYPPQLGAKATLTHDGGSDEFVCISKSGHQWTFHDYTVTPAQMRGKLKSMTTPGGKTMDASYSTAGDLTELSMSFDVPGEYTTDTVTESVVFTYAATGVGEALQVATVTLRRKLNELAFTLISRSTLAYYTASEKQGSIGDLKSVTQEVAEGMEFAEVGTYLMTYHSDSLLNEFLSPESYRRYLAGQGGLEAYADFAFLYDATSKKVTKSVAKAGSYETTFAYTDSAHAAAANNWAQKIVKTNPDSSTATLYANAYQQALLRILADGSDEWMHNREYSTSYFLPTLIAEPSAVASYDDAIADLDVTLNPSSGKIETRSYYTTGAIGYLENVHLKEGDTGTPILQKNTTWTSRTAGSVTIWFPSLVKVYRDTAGTQNIDTAFAFTWHTGTVQPKEKTTTPPVIPVSQNGDGVTYTRKQIFDVLGVPLWAQDELGFITYRGAGVHRVRLGGGPNSGGVVASVVQEIRDVDMNEVSGLPEQPAWTTPAGGGLTLVSDFEVDVFGRRTQGLGPVHDAEGQSVRTASWSVFKDAEHQAWSSRGFVVTASGKGYRETLVNPVSIQKMDHNGRTTDSIQAVRESTDGRLSPTDEFPQSTWCRWSTTQYANDGDMTSQRQYTSIPSSGEGSAGTSYLETSFGYDSMDRRNMTKSPAGDISRTVFDVRSKPTEAWTGTDDTGATDADPGGGGATGNNMVQVTANVYDGGSDAGDGNLTQQTQFVDDDAANNRVTSFIYDFRSRQTAIDGEVDFYQINTYDNLNQVTQVDRKDTTSGGNLVARSQTSFDDLGRVYKRVQVAVDPSDGSTGDSLVLENTFRDGKGQVIETTSGNAAPVRKSTFDGVGRVTRSTVGYESGGNDYFFDQVDTVYNEASQAIQRTLLQRYHDDTTTTGPLEAGTDARPQYTASYFDGTGRPVATAVYGTNGGVALVRPASVPARSDDVLVSETSYNDRGEAFESVDPMARVTHRDFDDAGRPVATIQNYLVGSTASDANITVEQAYDSSGRLASVTAKNADTGDQVTSYVWGVSDPKSDLASNSLLREMRFPGGKLDVTSQAYNRLGQVKEWTDQNGTVHAYTFDKLGRTTADELLAVGLNIDTAIMKIGLSYEVRGLVENITSYDGASVVKNEVVNEYNNLGQVTKQYQEHSGAKDGSTPYIWNHYDATPSSGEYAKDSRPTRRDPPDGTRLYVNYGAAASAADKMSRVDDLSDGTNIFALYRYLGMSTFVHVGYEEAAVVMKIDHGTAHAYAGFDRFNRIIDMLWTYHDESDLDRFKYGYDRNSSPVYAYNNVDTDFGNQYSYDALNRLTDAKRGTINTGTGVVADPDHREVYALDATGNWNGYFVQDGQTTWKQRREFNEVNEIVDLTNWVVPEYDLAGNMTTVPQPADLTEGYALTWDGWNRLVKVVAGTTTIAEFAYDGLMRRQTSDDQTDVRHFYYSLGWQVVEERLNALTTADAQYVWGIRYIDDLVRREKGAGEDAVIYALKDRMWSISSLVRSTEGVMLERYVYDPYGSPTVLTGTFGPRASSLYSWSYLFQGREWDSLTELYQFRMRSYHPGLGLFLSRDPLSFSFIAEGQYSFAGISPFGFADLSGSSGLKSARNARAFAAAALPDCPCCESTTMNDPRFVESSALISDFHTGASRCYRTATNVPVGRFVPGQQCCYLRVCTSRSAPDAPDWPEAHALTDDVPGWPFNVEQLQIALAGCLGVPHLDLKAAEAARTNPLGSVDSGCNGMLITSGKGAGSPDLFGPGATNIFSANFWRMVRLHSQYDVEPWKELGWELYNQIWPPNQGSDPAGNPCPKLHVTVDQPYQGEDADPYPGLRGFMPSYTPPPRTAHRKP